MKNSEINRCIDTLKEWQYLEYGITIPKSAFVTLFKVDCSESWEFLGPLLEIREELTEMGYLCTQRDIEFGCLKIYDVDEMVFHADRLFKNAGQRIKKLQKCMSNTKIDEFSRKDLAKHMHVNDKINAGLNAMRSILANL